jgi:hypothetical protein
MVSIDPFLSQKFFFSFWKCYSVPDYFNGTIYVSKVLFKMQRIIQFVHIFL